jgi:AcrR family transcriptional regulator
MHDSNHPSSRRSSGKLSHAAVLREALVIADAEGLDNLTMRKLASRLDSAPMSIYRYFPSKAAIEARLLDYVIGANLATDHDETDFRAWVRTSFGRIRRALLDHPGVLPLLGTSASFGPHAMRALDDVLARLRLHGLDESEAARALQILVNYTLGAVVLQAGLRREPEPEPEVKATGARPRDAKQLPRGEDLPRVRELAETLETLSPDASFEDGLERLLDLVSPERAARTSTMRPARSG